MSQLAIQPRTLRKRERTRGEIVAAENGWTNLISNSGKLVNTITAHRFNTVLRRTPECVDVACTGELR